ncbi:hypothetical protein Tco_0849209 [Tanacetum coccineum]
MADKDAKSTTRKIVANDQADYYSGITSITVNGKNAYELKGKFLDDLHKNAFSGTNGEDAVEHIEYFLKIVGPVDLPNVNQDKLRIVVFPISLVRDAWRQYDEYKMDWIYEWNENVSWVHKKPWTDTGVWTELALVVQCCKPFNYKSVYSKWPTCSWREDGYFNGGNLPGAYIVGNTLHYQDLEWYEALKDSELKEEALRNKAILDGLINEDDESSNNGWRRWDGYEIADHDQEEKEYENEHEDEERFFTKEDSGDDQVFIRNERRYVAIIEYEYEGLTNTSKGAIYAYWISKKMIEIVTTTAKYTPTSGTSFLLPLCLHHPTPYPTNCTLASLSFYSSRIEDKKIKGGNDMAWTLLKLDG